MEVELFLDSGAYSAWTRGVRIDIDDYIEFIKLNKEKVSVYANLDVLNEGEASYRNWLYMREKGLNPLPVYHAETDTKYLRLYMEQTDYIAIGAIAEMSTMSRIRNLDHLWSEFLVDGKGMPKVRVHGFGLTAVDIMTRYPWWSVDSTTWIKHAAFGCIVVPSISRRSHEKYDYSRTPLVISISDYASDRGQITSRHLNALKPAEQKRVYEWIEECGFTLGKSDYRFEYPNYQPKENERWALTENNEFMTFEEGKRMLEIVIEPGLRNEGKIRQRFNLVYFQKLTEHIPKWPWAFKVRRQYFGLLGGGK